MRAKIALLLFGFAFWVLGSCLDDSPPVTHISCFKLVDESWMTRIVVLGNEPNPTLGTRRDINFVVVVPCNAPVQQRQEYILLTVNETSTD